jgi:hypothetical protein
VIDKEYHGDKSPWGECVDATRAFVDYITGAAAGDQSSVASDLAYQLAQLYRDGPACLNTDTELPLAIEIAARLSPDDSQRQLIEQIATTIKSCQSIEAGAIDPVSVSPN